MHRVILIAMMLALTSAVASAYSSVRTYLDKPTEWYKSDEAARIAGNVLSFQAPEGGWPSNTETAAEPYSGKPSPLRSTFDNSATTDELRYLARVFAATRDPKYEQPFLKGLDHILEAQYENGGFPQSVPPRDDYGRYITFNDGTMIRLMFFLKEVGNDSLYSFVDDTRRAAARDAWKRGIDCVLKCQVKIDGKLTVWCAQHDEITFEPRPARKFEPVSLSGCETVGIVHALMAVEKPSPEIIASIDAAVAYLDSVKILGIKTEDRKVEGTPRGVDRFVVEDPAAPPIWARFYEIGTNKPIFSDRDSVIKYNLADIGVERRTGYRWLSYWPQRLIAEEYPAWKAKLAATKS